MGFKFNPLTGNFDLVNSGNVVGPASSTDNAIARYDGITGKLLQNSTVTLSDNGILSFAGSGEAITAGSFQIGRNADTGGGDYNKLQFNIPSNFGMEWSVNDVKKMRMLPSGHMEMGNQTSGDTSVLWVAETVTNSSSAEGIRGRLDIANTVENFASYYGLFFPVTNQGSVARIKGEVFGLYASVINTESQTIDTASGVMGHISLGAGTTTLATGVRGRVQANGGNATTTIALYAPPILGGAPSIITNSFGLKVDAPGYGNTAITMGIDVGPSYIAGRLHVGSAVDERVITLKVTGNTNVDPAANTALKVIASPLSEIESAAFYDVLFDFNRTVLFTGDGGGVPFDTYNFQIDRATYQSIALQDFGIAATVNIVGAPTASTNVTISKPYAFIVSSGNTALLGNLALGTSTNPNERLMVSGDTVVSGHAIQGNGWTLGSDVASTTVGYYYKDTSAQGAGITPTGLRADQTSNPTADNTSVLGGLFAGISNSGNVRPFTSIAGGQMVAQHLGTGLVGDMYGYTADTFISSAGNVSNATSALFRSTRSSTGNVTNTFLAYFANPADSGAGTRTNLTAIFIKQMTAATTLNKAINYDSLFQVHGKGNVEITPAASTSGSPFLLNVTLPQHLTLAASTLSPWITLDLEETVQFATGNIVGVQAGMKILTNTTYGFVGASTIDGAIGVSMSGLPQQGTNATVSGVSVLHLTGGSSASGTGAATSSGLNGMLLIDMPTIKDGIGTVNSLFGVSIYSGSLFLGNQTATLTNFNLASLGQMTLSSQTNVRTVTNPVTFYIAGAPVASTNVTFTNPALALHVDSGATRLDGSNYRGVTTDSSAAYTVLADDYIVHSTRSSVGAQTVNLPAVASNTGRILVIKDAAGNAGANNITIDGNGAETIDGAATRVINTNYGSVRLYSNGVAWFSY